MTDSPLLRIEDLRISFATRTSDVRAVDGVDLEIRSVRCWDWSASPAWERV